MSTEQLTMQPGKIYFLSYGGNTQIVGRFSHEDTTKYYFHALLHYWNGYETFRGNNDYCVHSGITEIRAASKAEKHALLQKEIEKRYNMTGTDRLCIVALCACILWLSIKMHSIESNKLNVAIKRLDIANERINLLRKHVNALDSAITYPKNEQK